MRSGEYVGTMSPPVPALAGACQREAFLRIPPFPGARISRFAELKSAPPDPDRIAEEVRRLRVGGTFWGAQPELPSGYVLVRVASAIGAAQDMFDGETIILWQQGPATDPGHAVSTVVRGDCDPWHMLSQASALVTHAEDELRPIAALLGVPCHIYDCTSGQPVLEGADAGQLLAKWITGAALANPVTGEPMSPIEAVQLCGFWRQLIDSNRDVDGGLGFAFWKQDHVAPLLWSGAGSVRFLRGAGGVDAGASVAVWRVKAPPNAIRELERNGNPLIEVEDGFLRSHGLGADCIPPLSITVDRLGPCFDPSHPSELECLLQEGRFDPTILGRARELRRLIVEAGLGKYDQGGAVAERPAGKRRHILVPGQVEDDRAVQSGGCGLVSNLELLKRVRARAPDAYILYKPHPDVLAGHRRGAVPERACLQFADELVGELPISSIIAMVDEVHVNTSLAGFEALLRGKSVTTYGVPFYAGWGLTQDLGPVPSRRTARLTIDELVAATLLIYPRYLDPVTRLPCPAEIVVARLSAGADREPGLIVGVRRIQGKLMRRLRSIVQ
jgi:capsular polysaccharide export protein